MMAVSPGYAAPWSVILACPLAAPELATQIWGAVSATNGTFGGWGLVGIAAGLVYAGGERAPLRLGLVLCGLGSAAVWAALAGGAEL